MNNTLNEIVVHINENINQADLDELEQVMRRNQGVISIGHKANQQHLMVVIYDSTVTHAHSLLHTFQDRGLHAQLIGM
ncbi:MAG: hypothetical protein WCA45_03330 [Thiobacillaceae bacterium]